MSEAGTQTAELCTQTEPPDDKKVPTKRSGKKNVHRKSNIRTSQATRTIVPISPMSERPIPVQMQTFANMNQIHVVSVPPSPQMVSNNMLPSVIILQPNNMHPSILQYGSNVVQQTLPFVQPPLQHAPIEQTVPTIHVTESSNVLLPSDTGQPIVIPNFPTPQTAMQPMEMKQGTIIQTMPPTKAGSCYIQKTVNPPCREVSSQPNSNMAESGVHVPVVSESNIVCSSTTSVNTITSSLPTTPAKGYSNLLEEAMKLSDIPDEESMNCDDLPEPVTTVSPKKLPTPQIMIIGKHAGETRIGRPLLCLESMVPSPITTVSSPSNFNSSFTMSPCNRSFRIISSPSTLISEDLSLNANICSAGELAVTGTIPQNTQAPGNVQLGDLASPIVHSDNTGGRLRDMGSGVGEEQVVNMEVDAPQVHNDGCQTTSYHNSIVETVQDPSLNASLNSSLCSTFANEDLLNYSDSVELSLEADSDCSPGPSPEREDHIHGPLVTPRKVFNDLDDCSLSPTLSFTPSKTHTRMCATSTPKSSLSKPREEDSKKALVIMAEVAKQIKIPPKRHLEMYSKQTPSPKKLKVIAPKPISEDTSPMKVFSPMKSLKESPRRKLLQQRTRAVLPKTLLISPSKRLADELVRRSASVSRRILSKSPNKRVDRKTVKCLEIISSLKKEKMRNKEKPPRKSVVRKLLPNTDMPDSQLDVGDAFALQEDLSDGNHSTDDKENHIEPMELRRKRQRRTRQTSVEVTHDSDNESIPDVPAPTDVSPETRQDNPDENTLADLMAACSTTRWVI